MANLLSSFLNGSSTFTYNNGTNVIPSYTLVQPTFSNTSTGASIFNQTFGSSRQLRKFPAVRFVLRRLDADRQLWKQL